MRWFGAVFGTRTDLREHGGGLMSRNPEARFGGMESR